MTLVKHDQILSLFILRMVKKTMVKRTKYCYKLVIKDGFGHLAPGQNWTLLSPTLNPIDCLRLMSTIPGSNSNY